MEHQELLKRSLVEFLKTINKKNFSKSYDEAVTILESYKDKMSKEDASKVLLDIDEELEMDQYQEDVFLEVDARLNGHCAEFNRIIWG